jgi:hypothetical protein
MKTKMTLSVLALVTITRWAEAQTPAASTAPEVFDTRPAFMQFVTNQIRVTNAVVVTSRTGFQGMS